MKKKHFILVLTILFLLIGQISFAQEGDDDDWGSWGDCDPVEIENDYHDSYDDEPLEQPEIPDYSSDHDNNDDGSDAGDDGGGTTPPPPPISDPCTPESLAARKAVSNLLNNPSVKNSLSNLPLLSSLPSSTPLDESLFTIKNTNGVITTTPTYVIGHTGGVVQNYTLKTIADVHNHPYPSAYAPSAQDLFALGDKSDKISGFQTSYIVSPDGNIYALNIDDASKLNDFINNNSGFVGTDNNFQAGTIVGDLFWDTKNELESQGYSIDEAYTRATALVLQDAGVSLLKSDSSSIDFKKIDITVAGTLPNGDSIYIKNDCN